MKVSQPFIPVGWGEVFDKISILDIKAEFCIDKSKLKNINYEIQCLQLVIDEHRIDMIMLKPLFEQLKLVNQIIWDTENVKRKCEDLKDFGEVFIKASRDSYIANDQRAEIKRMINEMLLSEIFEEKVYEGNPD
jgi:hypothetical protein